ncbi:MAG: hypothetical protein RL210_2648, partial [Pseudomonadota bacterium]
TDVAQADALGKAAVELALAGHNGVMPGICRLSDAPYRWEIRPQELEQIANMEKPLPADFISADGYSITPACRAYLTPLIQGEDYPPYKNGLPHYVQLNHTLVAKKLPPFEV